MRVFCINDNWLENNPFDILPTPYPLQGNTYTVIEESKCPCGCGAEGYFLQEVNQKVIWTKAYFIPISDIDEVEIAKNREYKIPSHSNVI